MHPMILFWLIALVLIAMALAFILPPLLGTRRANGTEQAESQDLTVYRSRIAALDEECRVGALTAADLAQAKNELARELLADASAGAVTAGSTGATRRFASRPWLAIAVGVGVPLLVIGLYQRLGNPGALDPAPAPRAAGAEPAVEEMVARLAERMLSEPENSQGWLLLGRSYMALQRYTQAADAFAAAHRLLGDSPELLANLAEAQALAGGQNFLGSPSEHLERALQMDPTFPRALWLGAFAAMQRGEDALAARRWQSLLDRQPPDSEAAQVLRGLIADTGVPGAAAASGDEMASAQVAPGLTVNVILADHLAAGLDGSETLFIFARAAKGPPMPLAVSRKRARDLPLTVVLDDSMAMTPEMKLSNFERVVVGARISRSGTATPSSGDLQGFSEPVPAAGADAVNVSITERVP
jgi:cytochrome c-type biogenesis protein CcmH